MKRSDKPLLGRKTTLPVETLIPFDIEYRLAFERLWIAESSEVFRASKPGHTADLLCFFLEKAQTRVQIFFGSLVPEIFDRATVVESAKQAIAMGRSIEVIFKSHTEIRQSPFLHLIAGEQLKNPQRVYLNLKSVPKSVQGVQGNFALVDNRAYIAEDFCSAYDPGAVDALSDLFSEIKQHLR